MSQYPSRPNLTSWALVVAGSGVATLGLPDSPGVPASTAASTLNATYNNLASVKQLLEENKGQVAGIILEPVVGNSGFIPPTQEFLEVSSWAGCGRQCGTGPTYVQPAASAGVSTR